MRFKKTLVAAAILGATMSGVSGTASAYVYALSHLNVTNFAFTPATNLQAVSNYVFTLQNTATLNGVPSAIPGQSASCAGIPGGATTCGLSPVLDAVAAEVPGGARGGQNNYGFVGTGSSYASSDSIIRAAELVNGTPSSEEQIAEANLLGNGQAVANAELQSTTNLVFNFNSLGGGGFSLSATADPDIRAAISEALFGIYSAQANWNASFTLTETATNNQIIWKPDGTVGPCQTNTIVGATCTETADDLNLNGNLSTGTNPSDVQYSYDAADVFGNFGLTIAGLPAGNYSLALNTLTSVNVIRQTIPEPVSLVLFGTALLGMGVGLRRRNREG